MKIIKPETVEKMLKRRPNDRTLFEDGVSYAYKQLLEFGVEELEEEKLDTDPCGDTIEYDGSINDCVDFILKVVLQELPEKKTNKIETDLNNGLMNIGWNECLIEITKRLKGE